MLAIKTAMAILSVPGVACFIVPYYILAAGRTPLERPTGAFQALSIALAMIGLYMIFWVGMAFVRRGKGTPIPIKPPIHLVIQGLYRYVRNPMYVGAVLIVFAEAIYFASWSLFLYAVGLWAILHIALVIYEEPQLKRRFGAEYEQYLKDVPRWIPSVPSKPD